MYNKINLLHNFFKFDKSIRNITIIRINFFDLSFLNIGTETEFILCRLVGLLFPSLYPMHELIPIRIMMEFIANCFRFSLYAVKAEF